MKVRALFAATAIVLACLPYQETGIYQCDPKSGRDCDAGLGADAAVQADAASGPDAVVLADAAAGLDAASGEDAATDAGSADAASADAASADAGPADSGVPDAGPRVCPSKTWCREDAAFGRSFINGVWANAINDVWAVGWDGSAWHWDGARWELKNTGVESAWFNGIWGAGPNDVWAVGSEGLIARWDGSRWTTFPGPSGARDALYGVWGRSQNGTAVEVWVVGYRGAVYRRLGAGAFTSVKPWDDSSSYFAVGGTATTVWVAGYNEIQSFVDPLWTRDTENCCDFKSISAGDTQGTWISSAEGKVLERIGAAWTPEMVSSPVNGLWNDGQRLWAVGDGIRSKPLAAGGTWSTEVITDPTNESFQSIHGAGGIVWATSYGAVYRRAP